MGRGRAWRWLVLPAAIAYAGLAVGLGLDRAAEGRPELARWIPSPFKSETHFSEARRFVAAGIPASALDPARQALLGAPANPAAPALLGTALLGKGDPGAADRAFRLAARLGWREPLTQLYWFQTSLAQNDLANAVVRFDAIARQVPDAPFVIAMAASLERTSEGHEAMARRIAAGANWGLAYVTLREGLTAEQIGARVEVMDRVGALGAQLGCDKLVQPARVLAVTSPAAGARLWRLHCPRATGQKLVIDGQFDQPLVSPEAQVPFEWAVTGHGGLDVGLVPGESGQALQVRSAASITLPFIEQLVPLAPGRYRLSWRSDAKEDVQRNRLLASLACERDLVAAQPGPGVPQAGRSVRDISLSPGCEAPWLRLWIAPGSTELTIDDLRVEPI